MNKHVLSACLIILLITAGCKKDEPQQQAMAPRLKLIKHSAAGNSTNYYFDEFLYDDDGRLKEQKSYASNNNDKQSRRYFYNGNQLQNLCYLNGIEQTYNSIYYVLNSVGLIETQTLSNNRFVLTHEFNSAGFVSRVNYKTENKPDGYSQYFYSNENKLDSIQFFDSNKMLSNVSVFTYIAGKRNTIGYENKGLKIFGKDQSLLMRKETRFIYTHPAGMGVRVKFFENEHEYSFDDQSRVKTATTTRTDFPYPSGNSSFYISGMFEYTYL